MNCSACTPIASARSLGHNDRKTIWLSHGAGNGDHSPTQTTVSRPPKTTGLKVSVTQGQYRFRYLGSRSPLREPFDTVAFNSFVFLRLARLHRESDGPLS